jgi:branched-chain amino acid transport system substrate-binding protein
VLSMLFNRTGIRVVSQAMIAVSAIATIVSCPITAAPAAPQKKAIRIGFIASLSGAGAMPSHLLLNGAQLYLDQCHHKMAGRPVEFFVKNDETDRATAAAKVRELVEQDNVNLITGVFFTHIAYAIMPTVDKYQIPLVDATAGGDDITQRKRSKWCIRTSFAASQQPHVLGEYAYKTLGYRRVATIGSDIAYGYEQVGGFQQSFEQEGGQVVQKLWTPLGFTNFTDILKTLRNDVDAVFTCNVGETALVIPKELKELGYKMPVIAGATSYDDSILEKMGADGVGGISAQTYSNVLDNTANKDFVHAYRAKFDSDPSFYSENGYTAMMWINKAIDALKGDVSSKEKLMQALRAVELPNSPRGPETLDAYGNPIDNTYILKMSKGPNSYRNVLLKTYEKTSQFWIWKPEEYLKQPVYTKDYPPCTHCSASK